MQLELNSTEFISISIKFKSIEFQSKRNAMQIDAEIENLLVISII
jgi:stalled ribosome rescue protein Dom34